MMVVEVRTELKPHELEMVDGFGSDPGTVFPNAASENQRVQVAKGRHHGPNVTGEPEAENINGGL
jgi:hypothetical protein